MPGRTPWVFSRYGSIAFGCVGRSGKNAGVGVHGREKLVPCGPGELPDITPFLHPKIVVSPTLTSWVPSTDSQDCRILPSEASLFL